jgi:hypothetical protein
MDSGHVTVLANHAVASGHRFRVSLEAMEVDFTPEQEAQPSHLANNAGTEPARLVKDAALRLLEDARFRAAVREGIEQADRASSSRKPRWTHGSSRCCARKMRIRWTPAAAADLRHISDYLKDRHPAYRQPTMRN